MTARGSRLGQLSLNEGRKKTFFCLVVNLIRQENLKDIKKIIDDNTE